MSKRDDYLRTLAQQKADEDNKRLNLAMRGREKVFGEEEELQAISAAREAASRNARFDSSNICGPGYEMINAPTSGGPRPRGQVACFGRALYEDPDVGYLMIVMRDGKWIGYPETPNYLWDVLRGSPSTNEFVRSALDGATWEETSYGGLPREKPDIFNLGRED